jgi:ketosteroid isomerase-like protein
MKQILFFTLLIFTKMVFSQTGNTSISETIIALEKEALEKWNQGNPNAYLDISANDVNYFDPFNELRLDGLEKLKQYYEPIKGQVHVSRYEMVNPKVTATNDMAVLTFNLYSFEGSEASKWNCTEVYRLEPGGQWKIVHTHWSFIKPLAN